uniref:Leucine-rich repeat extensin-like protein 3 n=1 Tax=Diabrotica virgifera virgifera TaxID=50390 RepID=A0A6P7GI56_DIAVI
MLKILIVTLVFLAGVSYAKDVKNDLNDVILSNSEDGKILFESLIDPKPTEPPPPPPPPTDPPTDSPGPPEPPSDVSEALSNKRPRPPPSKRPRPPSPPPSRRPKPPGPPPTRRPRPPGPPPKLPTYLQRSLGLTGR